MAIYGTEYSDTLYGTDYADISIFGRGGNDSIYGFGGDDIIDAGEGDDYVNGGSGSDTILGRAGNDFLWGDSGNDYIWGEQGNDSLYGADGDDYLLGGTGNDYLSGGEGADTLIGDLGNDILVGGNGDDRLNGYGTVKTNDSQVDNLTGGAGADYFVLGGSWGVSYVESGDGYAVIQDWNGAQDWVEVKGSLSQYSLEYKSVGGIGSSSRDTEIYFTDASGNRDRLAIIQDSTDIALTNYYFKTV